MGHIDEQKMEKETVKFLEENYTHPIERQVYVDGRRYADIVVRRGRKQDWAIEMENATETYRNGIGQALHYGRVGYIPILAIPINKQNLLDPDTDSGEILNVCAGSNVGLLGVDNHHIGHVDTGWLLRPFD